MKATALLRKQHREVAGLFKEAIAAQGERARRQVLDAITRQLQMHTTIEEELFYPAVKAIGTDKAIEMVGEAVEEHHVVKLVLGELPDLDPEAESYEAKMTVLKELVEHHVDEEHETMFPFAERKLDEATQRALGAQLATRAEELLGGERRRSA